MADAQAQPVALLHVAIGFFEGAVAHFAEVQQPFQAVIKCDKGTKVHHVGDGALDELPFVVARGSVVPGIRQQTLAAERDTIGLTVQRQHVHFDFFADLEHVTRVIDAVPSQLADVDQTVRATQINKRAEVAQAGNGAGYHIAFAQLSQQTGFLLGTPFTLGLALAEDQAAAVLFDLDHLDDQLLTDERVGRFATVSAQAQGRQVGAGDEPFQAVPTDQDTAAIAARHTDLGHFFALEQFVGLFPVIALQAHVDGNDQVVVLIAWVEDVHGDFIAGTQAAAVFVVQPLQVFGTHDTILLGVEVHDDFAFAHLQDDGVVDFTAPQGGHAGMFFQ